MQASDKDRILNFLVGNEPIKQFESWVYETTDLEQRVGKELYLELIEINYNDKFILDNLFKIIVNDYISNDYFEDFKLKNALLNVGWYQGRKIEIDRSKFTNSLETQNAIKIIEEYGGLKFVSPEKRENWSLTLIEFLKKPYENCNMGKYGLNKNLVCFATAHNDHIDIFVDADSNFYHLDNVVSEVLYQFNGYDFNHLLQEFLKPNYEDKFESVGKLKKEKIANTVYSK